jgi:hypothetical protein
MADVTIRVPLDEFTKQDLARMTADAVSRALARAAERITEYAKSIVPRRTGRLAESVKVSPTLKSVFMVWDPVDPVNQYHYAKVVDVGRPGGVVIEPKDPEGWLHFFWEKMGGVEVFAKRVIQGPMTPARFTDHMRLVAPQFVREAIMEEFQGLNLG